ncbi:MAG TPA: 50S ribosomal protein L16 [Candidatus Nanoarchaeia archaeon]|nr:50S ribosomal protein L16 [Candidatus Nanoarchaeia archaeon]
MAIRKALSYSKKYARPYTRNSRRKSKAYIRTIPHVKVPKFTLGNLKDYGEGKHKFSVELVAQENVQIRDNALEAGRMHVHKILEEKIPGQYFFAVRVHPHHFLRNNKTSGIAGADRLSTGMSHSFGIIEGRAAFVQKGKEIFFISCTDEKAAKIIRNAMESIKAKMPCASKVVFNPLK